MGISEHYVFVVVSSQLGPDMCTLCYIQASDAISGRELLHESLPKDMLVVSYVPIRGGQTTSWDFFEAFTKKYCDKFLGELKFRPYDFRSLVKDLGVDADEFILHEEMLLKRYSVIASCKKNDVDCSACFDWYAEDIDKVCKSVAKLLPNGSEICGIYTGTSSDVWPNCAGARVVDRSAFIEFLNVSPECMMRRMDDALLRYHGAGIGELEHKVFKSLEGIEDVKW